ncbi:hypothetical protein [Bacteroides helcogenes]|uniref:Lipoprotein n=1 Tax=Bacteroides helcogenes (strain ATCC 35417 / DSM 20613 / JCM 6297 / CCUG 15421 / P 36-108) TaxID=693979 RepID=E6SX04_BACT6|nr:hypothetical protein [Bacteroides helcogenes]ADV44692.1 hypothetical protein Bache_2748 [Bacteroides helcogenes P 36-108]MDY5238545.1 hypothetical protein [Bacteroides helcogenes]
MKVKLLFLVFVLYACGTKTVSEEESYDRITITTYENKYDENNRLSEVQMTRISHSYEKGAETIDLIEDKSTDYYTYINNEEFTVKSRSKMSGNTQFMRCTPQTEELLTLNVKGDTVYYSLWKYCDKSKRELFYARNIDNGYIVHEDDDYEEKNEYDGGGILIKSVRCYFDTGKKRTTYFFRGLSYEEAEKRIPHTDGDYDIVCNIEKISGDTLINECIKNGIVSLIEKTIVEESGKKKFMFDADMKLTSSFTELKSDGFDIHVERFVQGDYTSIDSTYYKNGKEVRSVSLWDTSKHIVLFKYDKRGNMVERVEKTKYFDTRNGVELINEMLQVVKENEEKKKSRKRLKIK